MIISKIANGIETKLYDKGGIYRPIRASMTNALEIFTTDKGERIATLYTGGKLRQAHKYSVNGDVLYVKKYSLKDNKRTLEILKPNQYDSFELKSEGKIYLAKI